MAFFAPNGANPLHFWWVLSRYPGYTSAPKMTRYSSAKLRKEMQVAGLTDLYTVGFDVYYTLNKWPHLKILDYPLGFMEKHFPAPKGIREILATNLVCLGKNK